MLETTTTHVKKLNRLGHQLALTEQMLHQHPLTQDQFGIVQTMLFYLNRQTRWNSAGPMTRFLITFQTALTGCQMEKSELGFIGTQMDLMQKATANVMAAFLSRDAVGSKDLIQATLQLVSIFVTYLVTQGLGDWKGLFPIRDMAAAKKGGQLLQELGVIWLLGTHTIEHFFRVMIAGIEMNERHKNTIQQIGLFYVILLIILLLDKEDLSQEELLDTMQRFMIPIVDSVENGISKAVDQDIITEEAGMLAIGHLQILKRALDSGNTQDLIDIIQEGFDAFGLSYSHLKEEAKHLTNVCNQINLNFKNIFHQAGQTMTTMNQAA